MKMIIIGVSSLLAVIGTVAGILFLKNRRTRYIRYI